MSAESVIPDLQATVLCEDIRQEINGMQTLVGVLSAIPTPQLPVRLIKLCLWTRWVCGQGTFKQTARIFTPQDASTLAESTIEFTLRDEAATATNVQFFGGLQFEQPGLYHIEVLVEDVFKLRFPIPVVVIQQQNPK